MIITRIFPQTQTLPERAYFAEIQPVIRQRLLFVLYIVLIGALVATVNSVVTALYAASDATLTGQSNIVLVKWLNVVIMCSIVMVFVSSLYLYHHNRLRHCVNLTIYLNAINIMLMAYLNGGIGEPALLLYQILLLIAGYFGSVVMLRNVTILLCTSIVLLYLLGLAGHQPPDRTVEDPIEVFLDLDQMIYTLVIMLMAYFSIKMFVGDYLKILLRLKDDQKALDYIANHDKLTGLPNRHACESHFNQWCKQSQHQPGQRYLLLFIDIDNFKNINTRFGHNGGDEALTAVAKRLDNVFNSEHSVVSRIGGDEFIVMLRVSEHQVEAMLDDAIEALTQPMNIFGQTEYVTCSIGVVDINKSNSGFKDEYLKADLAMNRAKKTGKNRYCFFSQDINDSAFKNIEIGAGLHDALSNDELTLLYQPQVDLATDKVVGAEALIRWIKPSGQLVSPVDFIPIAETNGSIIPITRWVIAQACQDCAKWHARGFDYLFVSVNVSSSMLAKGDLPDIIKRECDKAGLAPQYLEVELTESVLLENGDKVQRQLQDLRKMGVSLAIDDFGTGYSNLGYLSTLNVQKLKVDKCFVMDLLKSFHNQTIIQAIAHIAESFGMKTVVEGVEDKALVSHLQALRCTTGQGYLWSKPVAFNDFMGTVLHRQEH